MTVANLSQEQINERYENLPDILKETLWSAATAKRIWQLGQFYHLSDEKISLVARITGQILMGFVLLEKMSSEIQEILGIDTRVAQAISKELHQRIFSSLQEEISKAYSPIVVIPEIKLPAEPEVKPEIKTEKENAPKPLEIKSETVMGPAVLPKTPMIPTSPIISAPIIPTADAVSEKPSDKTLDKPFILHHETEAKSVGEKQRVSFPTTNWFQKSTSAEKREKPWTPASPVKIELETFNQKPEEKKEPVTAKTEAPKQRIVHYREAEISTPFGKTETPPRRIEMPIPAAIKTEAPKPKEPKAVSFDSFEVIKGKENEVGLEGNTINLKNNKQLQ